MSIGNPSFIKLVPRYGEENTYGVREVLVDPAAVDDPLNGSWRIRVGRRALEPEALPDLGLGGAFDCDLFRRNCKKKKWM